MSKHTVSDWLAFANNVTQSFMYCVPPNRQAIFKQVSISQENTFCCRVQILKQYAQQLSHAELLELAEACPNMSGRDLRDVCESAERQIASQVIIDKCSLQETCFLPRDLFLYYELKAFNFTAYGVNMEACALHRSSMWLMRQEYDMHVHHPMTCTRQDWGKVASDSLMCLDSRPLSKMRVICLCRASCPQAAPQTLEVKCRDAISWL